MYPPSESPPITARGASTWSSSAAMSSTVFASEYSFGLSGLSVWPWPRMSQVINLYFELIASTCPRTSPASRYTHA